MTVTIYHNPKCSNSRKVLEILQDRGIEPVVIEYLKTPLTKTALKELLDCLNVPVRSIIRTKEAVFSELELGGSHVTNDILYEAIAAHPTLLNRPIVVSPKGAKLCRPPELVNDIL